MIITREDKQRIVEEYKKTHSIDECISFVDGMMAMESLIDKKMRESK